MYTKHGVTSSVFLFTSSHQVIDDKTNDKSVQYVKGKMGVGQTIRGVVRIFTVAVGILFSVYAYCFSVYSFRLTILRCK